MNPVKTLHEKESVSKSVLRKRELMQNDLQELEESIYPSYQEIASNISVQKAGVGKHSQKLKVTLNNKAQTLHREIDTIIQQMQSDIDDMDSEHLAAINKQETVINQTMKEISHVILEVKRLLETNDVHLVSKYQSRNHKFKIQPTQLHVTLPSFTPMRNNKEQISKQIGSLSKLAIAWLPMSTAFLDEPQILANINIRGLDLFNPLSGVSCLSKSEFWACQNDNIIRLYNLQGELEKSIQTKSGNPPKNIAAALSGCLVYTDLLDRSINQVRGSQIQTLIRLEGWRPLHLCGTSTGELLVIMESDDGKQTKVVRYSGSAPTQIIQKDDQGQPLYSPGRCKFVCENKNLNICVADYWAGEVIGVSAAGKLRFRYTGPPSTTNGSFKPFGIIADSRASILTADHANKRIHIIDQIGNFLRYIDNCDLHHPMDLGMDTSDNLFIAEAMEVTVKKIQYYK